MDNRGLVIVIGVILLGILMVCFIAVPDRDYASLGNPDSVTEMANRSPAQRQEM